MSDAHGANLEPPHERGPARDAREHEHGTDHAGHEHHGPTLLLLIAVFVILMLLTLLTVGITAFDFGYRLNLAIALGIAFVKAIFVGVYFMHLRWDPPIFAFTLVASLGFVTLFIVFSLIDTAEALPYIEARAVQQAATQ